MNGGSPASDAIALEHLHQQCKREEIARARSMSGFQRLDEAFNLTNDVFRRMHEGALHQLGDGNLDRAWELVRARLHKLRTARRREPCGQPDAGRATP